MDGGLAEGLAWVVYPPLWWYSWCRGLAFAPGISEVAVWILAFLYLYVQKFAQLLMRVLFLAPYCFFIFCRWRRWLSRCKHGGKVSQVPAYLNTNRILKPQEI